MVNSCTHIQIVYVLGAQNVKDQVSSIKSLDLVAIQTSASILRKSENPKIYKGKSAAEQLRGAAKSSPRHEEHSSFFKKDRDGHPHFWTVLLKSERIKQRTLITTLIKWNMSDPIC